MPLLPIVLLMRQLGAGSSLSSVPGLLTEALCLCLP